MKGLPLLFFEPHTVGEREKERERERERERVRRDSSINLVLIGLIPSNQLLSGFD